MQHCCNGRKLHLKEQTLCCLNIPHGYGSSFTEVFSSSIATPLRHKNSVHRQPEENLWSQQVTSQVPQSQQEPSRLSKGGRILSFSCIQPCYCLAAVLQSSGIKLLRTEHSRLNVYQGFTAKILPCKQPENEKQ